jgi:hypothetical protein
VTPAPFVLGLDLEGVCTDCTDDFRRFVAAARGVPAAALPDPVDRDWSRCGWGISFREGYLDLPARVITHRLLVHGAHTASAADTVAWLEQHRIPYRGPASWPTSRRSARTSTSTTARPTWPPSPPPGCPRWCSTSRTTGTSPAHRVHDWAEAAEAVLQRVAAHALDLDRTDLAGDPA